MESNPVFKAMVLKAYKKTSSISGTLEIVKPMFPDATEAIIINLINDKMAVVEQREEDEKPKKEVTKSSARIMQSDAYSALIAVQSKLVKFEKEHVKDQPVPDAMSHALRKICEETFMAIKEIG